MPRKPKVQKEIVKLVIDGTPYAVRLHPPAGDRTSWFAYWNGLKTSKSTGQQTLEDATAAVEHMVRDWLAGGQGKRATPADCRLTDAEFEEIQRVHFSRKKDAAARKRSDKTLTDCLEAIEAFKAISGLKPITVATADDCARFQREASKLPRNWRQKYPKRKKDVPPIKPNTVLKWSRQLAAAWNRANRNAGKKCVRGVVDEAKLLSENPWTEFTGIDGEEKPIRQFDHNELTSLLDYLEREWSGVPVATTLAKVFIWSSGRSEAVTSLMWSSLRTVGNEYHFETEGKRGVKKWFRVPEAVYQELVAVKTDSPYVFAAFKQQLKSFHERQQRTRAAQMVKEEFRPINLANWLYDRVTGWAETSPNGHAYLHVFRKTTMQYTNDGEDILKVAADLRVSPGVMMDHYVKKTDLARQRESNRTYQRIVASLPPELARRYGHVEPQAGTCEEQLKAVLAAQDLALVKKLLSELEGAQPQAAG